MQERRGIGPKVAAPAKPTTALLHVTTEMRWMGAVDHVIGEAIRG